MRTLPCGGPIDGRPGSNEHFLNRITLTRNGSGTAWLTGLSVREAAGGPNLLVDANPNLPRRGVYHQIDAFMLDEIVEAARMRDLHLQLCVTMRDLYMQALRDPESAEYDEAIRDAQNLLRYFVARWGYSTSIAAWEYFNEIDPGKPTDRFYRELGEYLERIDPYGHPRTTSTWSSSHRDWRHGQLDMAEAHFYLRPSSLKKTPDVVAAVLDQARDLREHSPGRPMLLAEFGLADEKWGLSPRMKEDQRLEHFHNALWASSLSGLSGTAMFWWWEQLDRRDAYHHYRPLADFLKTVPFGAAGLEAEQVETRGPRKILAVGLKGPQSAHYWFYDRDHSWERGASQDSETTAAGVVLPITGLAAGNYTVEWWDTWNGRVVRTEDVTLSGEGAELTAPNFSRDIACRVVSRGTR